MRSLVISIFLYACKSWTLTAELEKRTQAFEMGCYRRLLNIPFKDHVINEDVRREIQSSNGKYNELLTLVKKRKRRSFWPCLKVFCLSKDISAGHSARKKKKGKQKRRGVKTILRSGQGWTLLAKLGQLKTELSGKGLL